MRAKLLLTLTLAFVLPALAAAQGVRFRGVIADEDGEPVVDALVRIQAIAQNASISGSGKSKKGGRYGLFVMHPARQYRITVTKDGFETLSEVFDSGSAWTKENQRIERDFTLVRGESAPPLEIPGDVRVVYNRGVVAFNRRDFAEARQKFETVLEIRPRLVPAHVALAESRFFDGDFEAALASAQRAIELEEGNRRAAELLEMIQREISAREQAEEPDGSLNENYRQR